jgi:hypothetical protein
VPTPTVSVGWHVLWACDPPPLLSAVKLLCVVKWDTGFVNPPGFRMRGSDVMVRFADPLAKMVDGPMREANQAEIPIPGR